MPTTATINTAKGKPPRSDHVAVYGLQGNQLLALGVDASGRLVTVTPDGPLSRDDLTGAAVVITAPHNEVHEGNMWTANLMSADGDQLADNASLDLLIRVPGDPLVSPHLVMQASSSGLGELLLYEGTTITDEEYGAAVAEIAMNRENVQTAQAVVTSGPTVAAVGTFLTGTWLPGGTKNKNVGGVIRPDTEFILALSQNYLVRFTNRSGGGVDASVNIQWYEEEN